MGRWKAPTHSSFINIYIMMARTLGAADLRGRGWEASSSHQSGTCICVMSPWYSRREFTGQVKTKQWKATWLTQCHGWKTGHNPTNINWEETMKADSQGLSGHRTLSSGACVGDGEGLNSTRPIEEEPDLHQWDKSFSLPSFFPSSPWGEGNVTC